MSASQVLSITHSLLPSSSTLSIQHTPGNSMELCQRLADFSLLFPIIPSNWTSKSGDSKNKLNRTVDWDNFIHEFFIFKHLKKEKISRKYLTQISISFNDYSEIVLIERKVRLWSTSEALTAQLIPFLAKKKNQENNFLRRADKSDVNVLDNSLQSLGGGRLDLAHKYSFCEKIYSRRRNSSKDIKSPSHTLCSTKSLSNNIPANINEKR